MISITYKFFEFSVPISNLLVSRNIDVGMQSWKGSNRLITFTNISYDICKIWKSIHFPPNPFFNLVYPSIVVNILKLVVNDRHEKQVCMKSTNDLCIVYTVQHSVAVIECNSVLCYYLQNLTLNEDIFLFMRKVYFIWPITHVVDELCIQSTKRYTWVVIINIQLLHTFGKL